MKKLDTSPIAPGISMYVKGGTLQFLQLSYQEALTELTTSRIGSFYDPTKCYILNGCINTGTGSNYVISAGSIFYNGEVFLVPGATFTISGTNVAEGVITTSQYTTDADPTDFTDGIARNVHNIRQIVFQAALSGSGAADFNNLINLAYRPIGAIGQTIEWLMPGTGTQMALLATYFNPTTLQGIHPLTQGWIIDDGGYFTAAYLASDPNFGTIGATGGSVSQTLAMANLPAAGATLHYTLGNNYAGSSTNSAMQSIGPGQPVSGTTDNLGSGTAFSILPKFKTKLKITRVS